MTEVLLSSPPHFASPSSSSSPPCVPNDISHHYHHQHTLINPTASISTSTPPPGTHHEIDIEQELQEEEEKKSREREGDQLSLVTLLVTAFRRSIIGCSITATTATAAIAGTKLLCKMEIGVPTDVRHVAHVTFDRFNGFLGLPAEFEPEVPRRAPSASATVFGVSTESMQLSYDSRGNSVPTILLMMQSHLYAQGGLQAEGIFRITAGNSQEEYVRDQLNRGVIPEDIDVHCLAGLIKAWFRELPTGVLDTLPPEELMQSQSEEECVRLARLLPPTEAALLDWAINLMADVVQLENLNKMNARNVAMVFAPNMTQMSDPLTALMHAVQVMNFLKTLIIRTLKEREDSVADSTPVSRFEPSSDKYGHQSSLHPFIEEAYEDDDNEHEEENTFVDTEATFESPHGTSQDDSTTENGSKSFLTSIENIPGGNRSLVDSCSGEVVSQVSTFMNDYQKGTSRGTQARACKNKAAQPCNSNIRKGSKKVKERVVVVRKAGPTEKSKGISISVNPQTELSEAWR